MRWRLVRPAHAGAHLVDLARAELVIAVGIDVDAHDLAFLHVGLQRTAAAAVHVARRPANGVVVKRIPAGDGQAVCGRSSCLAAGAQPVSATPTPVAPARPRNDRRLILPKVCAVFPIDSPFLFLFGARNGSRALARKVSLRARAWNLHGYLVHFSLENSYRNIASQVKAQNRYSSSPVA